MPKLQKKYNALASSIMLGIIWGIWHLPLVLTYGESLPLYLFSIVGATVLMSWVYNSTGGNLLMMLLFHASLNASLNVLALTREDPTTVILTWITVGFVIWKYGRNNLSKIHRYSWNDDIDLSKTDKQQEN